MPLCSRIWIQMFWAICLYLALVFGVFVFIKCLFHASASDLVGPYSALAVPGVIAQLLAKWLRDLEVRGSSPKRLAFGWALMTALFSVSISAALLYSAMKFQLINSTDAAWVFGIAVLGGGIAAGLAGYNTALTGISARAKGS